MTAPDPAAERLATRILDAVAAGRQIAPFAADEVLDTAAAYRISAAITAARMARGETPVGTKIGFTNRTIWDEYGVHAPIYGPVYDTTVRHVTGPAELSLAGLLEPRIEPEIVFRFKRAPTPDMDEDALSLCLDGVAHGFEIVQSLFPGWRFTGADTIAAFALHGRLVVGPFTPMPGWRNPDEWRRLLERFTITLARNGTVIDTGKAENVLGGPLSALKHFIHEVAANPLATLPGPGDVVTTGTVTRAFPVAPGERWTTVVDGLVVEPMDLAFTA